MQKYSVFSCITKRSLPYFIVTAAHHQEPMEMHHSFLFYDAQVYLSVRSINIPLRSEDKYSMTFGLNFPFKALANILAES